MTTQARVKELFDYCDGKLIRRNNSGRGSRWEKGRAVGSPGKIGYLATTVDGKKFLIHRLIWLWHFGYFPESCIDHIDRCKTNNRIENLREVSPHCNMRNTKQRNSISGVKGVYLHRATGKWAAHIRVNNKNRGLGYTDCLLEAACLRLAAEQALGWTDCDSTSPAYAYVKEHLGL
jgi:hypothetical protein